MTVALNKPSDEATQQLARLVYAALRHTPDPRISNPNSLPVDLHGWGMGEVAGFDRLDRDGDGKLTVEELAVALATFDEAARRKVGKLARASLKADGPRTLVPLWAGLVGWGVVLGLQGWFALSWLPELLPLGWVAGLFGVAVCLVVRGVRRAIARDRRDNAGRRRLVKLLSGLVQGTTLGLDGASLASGVFALLDRSGGRWFGGLQPGQAQPFELGDGRLDAEEWGATRLPRTQEELAEALATLPLPRRQAVAGAIDAARVMARQAALALYAGCVGGGVGWLLFSSGLAVGTGSRGKHGRYVPPDHATGDPLLAKGLVVLIAATACILAARWLVGRLRRQLAATVRAQLGAGRGHQDAATAGG